MEAILNRNNINDPYSEFEKTYIRLRKSENRIFSDDEVLHLPNVPKKHPHFKEWKMRKQSANQLFKYLKSLKRPLSILEVGCGNGWLSDFLSNLPQTNTTGIDVNQHELNQARKLFYHKVNLRFVNGSIENLPDEKKYDIILFASSIQYFSTLTGVLNQSLKLLNDQGEIHIIDTMFYRTEEIADAQKRSSIYFDSMGHKDMVDYYYHHKLEDLSSFNVSIMKHPSSVFNHLFFKNPFYWIRIKS